MFQKLCNVFNASTYDDSSSYSLLNMMREIMDFPSWLPIPTWIQHGMYLNDRTLPSDLQPAKRYGSICLYNAVIGEDWKKHSSVPAFVTGPVTIQYRRFRHWEQSPDARGSVFFPSHSIADLHLEYSFEKIRQELDSLPEEFKPVTVCLFWFDYQQLGHRKIYEDMGFRTVTAGPPVSPEFTKNFYGILTQARYACSNLLGTYVLYALDLGIPFFLVGDLPAMNVITQTKDLASRNGLLDSPREQRAYGLFRTGPQKEISEEQRAWFREETAQDSAVPLKELRPVLIRMALTGFLWPKLICRRIVSGLKKTHPKE